MWDMLAQASTVTEYAQPAGFIAVLVFILRWFMTSLDKRNDVIEKMASRSNDVIDRNTKAFTNFSNAMRNSPCGRMIEEEKG